jgi:hypothetical protein
MDRRPIVRLMFIGLLILLGMLTVWYFFG